MQSFRYLLFAVLLGTRLFDLCAVELVTQPNTPLLLLAHDLTTNGVPILSAPPSKLMVAAVSPVSAKGGTVSLVNTQRWIAQSAFGHGFAMDIDPDGNVVVTGSGWQRMLTSKFSPDGVPLWTRELGPFNRDYNQGLFITTDTNGNIYSLGDSGSYESSTDVLIAKYSREGIPIWTNRFNDKGTNYQYPSGIAVDGQGNCFVGTGSSEGVYVLLKFSPNGVPVWTNRFNPGSDGSAYLQGPFLDGSGAVYACGSASRSHFGSREALRLKYNSAGKIIQTNWVRRSGVDFGGTRAVMDSSGSIVLTGDYWNPTSRYYSTLKFAPGGAVLWTNLLRTPKYQGGYVPDVRLDLAGNVFVTGGTPNAPSTNVDLTIVKLTPGGQPLWTNRLFLPGPGFKLGGTASDSAGAFYLSTDAENTRDGWATSKYSADGRLVWQHSLAGNQLTSPSRMKVDSCGNVYVSGSISDSVAVVKYSDFLHYIPPAGFIGTDTFTITVFDNKGAKATANVTVHVTGLFIKNQPTDQNVAAGQNATFSVVAEGPELKYQWMKGLSDIPEATNSSYTISNVQHSDLDDYQVVVWNQFATVVSSNATLSIVTTPAIWPPLQDQVAVKGDLVNFGVNATGGALSYQWFFNSAPIITATNSFYSFTAAQSTIGSYAVVVSNAAGTASSSAQFQMPVAFGTNGIGNQVVRRVLWPGSNTVLQVSAEGSGPFSYQWYRQGDPIPGATNDHYSVEFSPNATGYWVVVTDAFGEAQSELAVVGPHAILHWQGLNGTSTLWYFDQTHFITSRRAVLPMMSAAWSRIGISDFNLDGSKDILWRHTNGTLAFCYMEGLQSIGADTLRTKKISTTARFVGVANFNAAGSPDLLWQNSRGQLITWFMQGTNVVSSAFLRDGKALGLGWTARTATDLDNDGHGDVLLQHTDGRVVMWRMVGTALDKSVPILRNGKPLGKTWKLLSTVDFSLDGNEDLLFRQDDGRMLVWLMDGTNVVGSAALRNGPTAASGTRLVGAE